MADLRTSALPPTGSTNWYTHYSALDQTLRAEGGQYLDTFPGATDDDKLTAALSYQAAQSNRPPIVLSARTYNFNQTRSLYSGLHLIGTPAGPKNLELSGGVFVPSRIVLGAAVTSGAASWWVGSGDIYDIYMAHFGVQGNSGASVHQFLDHPVTGGTLYACQFHSLSFNMMRGVIGTKAGARKAGLTQVVFSGHWTANNLWDTQFHIGGSDNSLWMGGMINIGPSASPAQTGTYADNDYELIFDSLSKTDVGYIYCTALNGWRGVKITGNANTGGLHFFGGVYEGYNAGTPAPGSTIRIEGGAGAFYGPKIGQAMGAPDPAEGGVVHMTGGQWSFYSPSFYRGNMAEIVPMIYQTGGRLSVIGATQGTSETWTSRPRLDTSATGAPAANATTYSTYCPDLSMTLI